MHELAVAAYDDDELFVSVVIDDVGRLLTAGALLAGLDDVMPHAPGSLVWVGVCIDDLPLIPRIHTLTTFFAKVQQDTTTDIKYGNIRKIPLHFKIHVKVR